jgi:regulator of PEP synthase PpsR (kinase-PPPase family)
LRTALALFERQRLPYLDVTDISVEEIASRILDRKQLERHVNL